MIQQNRTYLLQQKEKRRAIISNLQILKARRHALIMEFLKETKPYLKSRDEIRALYQQGLQELHLALGKEGDDFVSALAGVSGRAAEVEIETKNILGIRYKEIQFTGAILKTLDQRPYDWQGTAPNMEETFHLFEKILEAMLKLASFELKLKKLGEEITKITRRTRVLEERILPRLGGTIKKITQYIGEREREEFFRLKKFKEMRHDAGYPGLSNEIR